MSNIRVPEGENGSQSYNGSKFSNLLKAYMFSSSNKANSKQIKLKEPYPGT